MNDALSIATRGRFGADMAKESLPSSSEVSDFSKKDFHPVCNQIEFLETLNGKPKNRTLHNKLDKKTLIAKLKQETEPRVTISLYRYLHLENLPVYRAELYKEWENLKVEWIQGYTVILD